VEALADDVSAMTWVEEKDVHMHPDCSIEFMYRKETGYSPVYAKQIILSIR
jgi:hypothetical protein